MCVTTIPRILCIFSPSICCWRLGLTILSRQLERSRNKSLDVVLLFNCPAFLFDTRELLVLFTFSAAVLLFLKGPGERRTGGKWGWGQVGGCALPTTHFLLLYPHPHTYLPVGDSLAGGMRFPSFAVVSLSVPQNCPFPAELSARGLFLRK